MKTFSAAKAARVCLVWAGVSALPVGAASTLNRPDPNLYAAGIRHSQLIQVPKDYALEVSRRALEEIGYEIETTNFEIRLLTQTSRVEPGTIRTKRISVPSPGTCDCGTWNLETVRGQADSLLKVTVRDSKPGVVEVKLTHYCSTTFTGRDLDGKIGQKEEYLCASRGSVEAAFFATLKKVLQTRAPSPSTKPDAPGVQTPTASSRAAQLCAAKVKVEEDRFTGIVTVNASLHDQLEAVENRTPTWDLFWPDSANAATLSVSKFNGDSQYLRCSGMDMLVDGKRMSPTFVSVDSSVSGGSVLEVEYFTLTSAQILKLATAKLVEYRLCNDEFTLSSSARCILLEFARKVEERRTNVEGPKP